MRVFTLLVIIFFAWIPTCFYCFYIRDKMIQKRMSHDVCDYAVLISALIAMFGVVLFLEGW